MIQTEIPATMVAAVYHPGNNNLVVDKQYPLRQIEDDEILLKVSACGVCHSDVLTLTGVALDTRTYIYGHEIAGVAVRAGKDVDKRITLGTLYSVLTPNRHDHGVPGPIILGTVNSGSVLLNSLGHHLDGGYAEYVIVKPANLVAVPDGVSPEVAAVAGDAGVTAYNAVKHTARVTKGSKVLIFGIGGLGHLAVQYAKHLGATVYACDFKPEARKLALELGADAAFDLIDLTNKTATGNFTVDATIDFVVNSQTFNLAMVALSGNALHFPDTPKLVLVGVSAENLVFFSASTVVSGVQILTSTYGPKSAAEEVLDLFAKGTIRAHIEAVPLEDVNKALNDLRASQITGRKVVVPGVKLKHCSNTL
ncbi:GroES-like protein [Mycena vitilis]|nr:GroES-like protein [Mycena vitilis]